MYGHVCQTILNVFHRWNSVLSNALPSGLMEGVTPESIAGMNRMATRSRFRCRRCVMKRWMGYVYEALLLMIWEELSLRIQH